jgi:DNA-binding response OmpR family regulator
MPPDSVVLGEEAADLPPRGLVLVAEDDRDLRDIIAGFLEAKGWRVVALANGPEALERAREERFKVAVLDVRSPSSRGLGVLQTLRAWGSTLPVIVITSFGDAFLSARAMGMGATLVLEKPFDLEDLERAVNECTVNLAERA